MTAKNPPAKLPEPSTTAIAERLDRIRVMLRTTLFSTGGPDAHLPPGVSIVDGRLLEGGGMGLLVDVDRVYDGAGRALEANPCVLLLPSSKIDHVLVLEAV